MLAAVFVALLTLLAAPALASAESGTVTAKAIGLRASGSTSDLTYGQGLAGASFDVSSTDGLTWNAVACSQPGGVSDGSGDCALPVTWSGSAAKTFAVRERPAGAAAGWGDVAVPGLNWGGDAFNGNAAGYTTPNPLRDYWATASVPDGGTAAATFNNADGPIPTPQGDTSHAATNSPGFANVRNNPALPSQCGMDIVLLLDTSGSTIPFQAQYAQAGKDFVDSLAGTPTRLKIYSFASTATTNGDTTYPLQTSIGVGTAKAKVAGVYGAGGGTNWDQGLRTAAGADFDPGAGTDRPDLVVFVTDGNPTSRDSSSTNAADTGTEVNLLDLTHGIASANLIKDRGSRLLALGVGDGVTDNNLKFVSGPAKDPVAGVGDYYTSSTDGLRDTLKSVTNQLCGSRIHVRKQIDPGSGGAPVPAAGWGFALSAPPSPITVDGTARTTGASGEAQYLLDAIPGGAATSGGLTITENPTAEQRSGYVFASGSCNSGSYSGPAIANVSFSPAGATAPDFQYQRNQDWYCTFTSKPRPQIQVAGVVEESPQPALGKTGVGAPVSGVVLIKKPGDAAFSRLLKASTLPVGTTVDVTDGHIRLTFQSAPADLATYGPTQSAEFWGGEFRFSQDAAAGLVDVLLTGDQPQCEDGSPVSLSNHATSSATQQHNNRFVWGKGKGKFRTTGNNGAASVRGTYWYTSDRCDGTYFLTKEGVVEVEDFVNHTTRRVKAGGRYLARVPCASRRAFSIRLLVPVGTPIAGATVLVNGSRVRVRLDHGRPTATINLKGRPKQRVRVRITLRLPTGKVLSGVREYNTCKRRVASKPPKL